MEQTLLQRPEQAQPQAGDDMSAQGAMFEKLAGHALDQLYGQGLESVQQRLRSGDLVDAMGSVVAGLIAGTYQAALKKGVEIPPDVVVAAIMQVCKSVAEIAFEMKLLDTSNAKVITEDAVFEAVKVLATQVQLSPEQKQGFKQSLELLEAGAQGARGQQAQPEPQPQPQPQGAM